jgi:hypothetical protein
MQPKVYAQGDVILIAVADLELPADKVIEARYNAVILAEGEATGHRHAFYGGAVMLHDDTLTRGVPRDLYIGHVKVAAGGAVLEHGSGPGQRGDHEPVHVPSGTFMALRQREYTPFDRSISYVAD